MFEINSNILTYEDQKKIQQFLTPEYDKFIDLKLLYQGSKDGFTSQKFHDLCDKQGETLIVIKNDKNKKFGGSVSKSWDQSIQNWVQDEKAFLFSLDLNKKYQIKQNKKQYAIWSGPQYGPYFGSGADLHITQNCNAPGSQSMLGQSYEAPSSPNEMTGEQNFIVLEIEVYKVEYFEKED